MIKKTAINIFSKNEILTEENFYGFREKKKIVTYVPEEFVNKLMTEMSKAGAGRIGNYEMCSFRITGTGTFKPGENAKPFKGKKHNISYEKEVRFEMECDNGKLNHVLDVMLKHHPYEEAAYEVFNFYRRDKEPSGKVIILKKKVSDNDLLKRLNKKIMNSDEEEKILFDKIAITYSEADEMHLISAKITECNCLITRSKSNYKLYKI